MEQQILTLLEAKQTISALTSHGIDQLQIKSSEFNYQRSKDFSLFPSYEISQHQIDLRQMQRNSKNSQGRWNIQQQIQYLNFIQTQRVSLSNKQGRRSTKIFKMMSKFIKTRGPDQCRSHHQKMQKKYNSMEMIIENCKKSLIKNQIENRNLDIDDVEVRLQNIMGQKVQNRSGLDYISDDTNHINCQLKLIDSNDNRFEQAIQQHGIYQIESPQIEDVLRGNQDSFELLI